MPLGPTVPTAAPSTTRALRSTLTEPRWVRLTARPSAVWIVTLRPFVGTVPAKLTTPGAGASTGVPPSAPIAMPRCCPAAYGCAGSNENVSSTGPRTGHVHACAPGTKIAKMSATGHSRSIARHIAVTALLSRLKTEKAR